MRRVLRLAQACAGPAAVHQCGARFVHASLLRQAARRVSAAPLSTAERFVDRDAAKARVPMVRAEKDEAASFTEVFSDGELVAPAGAHAFQPREVRSGGDPSHDSSAQSTLEEAEKRGRRRKLKGRRGRRSGGTASQPATRAPASTAAAPPEAPFPDERSPRLTGTTGDADATTDASVAPSAAPSAPALPLTASSLFFRSGVATDLTRTEASLASLAVSPLRAGGSPMQSYEARVREFIVNPFNGREVSIHSPIMKQFESLGFHRDAANPLQLAWSPETYFRRFHTTLWRLQRQRLRDCPRRGASTVKRERRRAKPQAKGSGSSSGRRGRAAAGRAEDAAGVEGADGLDQLEDVTTEDVLSVMLKAFETGPRTPLWRVRVAELMRRRDALTAVPAELRSRYESLTSAFMPPKLDATPDPAIHDVVLTQDQENVAQLAMRGYSLFVGGSAGTGKTVLIKAVYHKLSQLGLRVAMTATTGVAAVQLGGCTFHRAFNVPVEENAFATRKPWDHNALRAVDVLIVDEVSLLSARMVDALDMEARLARMHFAPFGGVQVIFCGDFLQLASEVTVDALPAYQSEAFQHLLRVKLVTPMRHVAGDPLVQLLRQLRRGRCDAPQLAALDRPIPTDAREVTYIFPRRRDAQQLNDAKLAELQTEEMVCTPQRGPLELVGTFTHAALLTFDKDEALPLPSRDAIIALVKEEVAAAVLGGPAEGTADGGERWPIRFKELADHDVVVMPTRTTTAGVTLRLRVHVDPLEAARRREAIRESRQLKGKGMTPAAAARRRGGEAGYPEPFDTGAGDAGTALDSASGTRVSPEMPRVSDTAATADTATPESFLRSPTAHMLHHPEVWADVVSRVAARLHGTVVGLFEREPTELVPLSVSSALADPTDSDGAESLQPLRLKLGARVMVNRNLSRTVSNGSVGIVEAFAPPEYKLFPRQVDMSARAYHQRALGRRLFEQLPVVRLLSGEVVQIPPVAAMVGGSMLTYYYGHEVYTLPLQLGYGFTVHKVQGLTLRGLVVLDCAHFFACPHLIYVACSRVRSLEQLIVWNLKPEMVMVKKSALDFSDSLQEAKDALVLAVPPDTPRAAWATHFHPRVYAL